MPSMSAREVAMAARQTIRPPRNVCGAVMPCWCFQKARAAARGRCSAFFPVSRATSRRRPVVLPIGLCGTEHMFGDRRAEARRGAHHDEHRPRASRCSRFAHASGSDRRAFVDRLGSQVAALLPPHYQGVLTATDDSNLKVCRHAVTEATPNCSTAGLVTQYQLELGGGTRPSSFSSGSVLSAFFQMSRSSP